jgi:mycothione reductase
LKEYDVIVLGAGCGLNIVRHAVSHDKSVALIEPGALGGTCVNVGCIPSKMLIVPADSVVELQRARRLGVHVRVESIDVAGIMKRMRDRRKRSQVRLRRSVRELKGVDYVVDSGTFVGPHAIATRGEVITAPLIFVAAGTRTLVPDILGLESVDYLTSDSLLELTDVPESLIIMGGGYIAAEYCHFFAAMGTAVTVLEMADRLVTAEEPEISATLERELGKRARIVTGARVVSVAAKSSGVQVTAQTVREDRKRTFRASRLLVAVGRRSNADVLEVDEAGIRVDTRGFIEVDDHLRTSQPGVYAVGDINGKAMFRHVANVEAAVASSVGLDGEDVAMDYSALPHAVYSYPQIASVGLTEAQAREAGLDVTVTVTPYSAIAKGEALSEDTGFAKAVFQTDTDRILGFHIIGPYAPILIQEVVTAMQSGGHVGEIAQAVHIHPELTELITSSFEDLT